MRNLLITTIGTYNHLDVWLNGNRNFDVAIINYSGCDIPQEQKIKCVYYNSFSTFKYPGIAEAFFKKPSLLEYDYFWMPDEDIYLPAEKISQLFDKMNIIGLDLAQPSVENSAKSFPSWKIFEHKLNVDIIYTNFIEIMCPVFSRAALDRCLETFRKSLSGWGLDIVWTKLVGDNDTNIGILNDIVVKHTRRVQGGSLYPALMQYGVRPSEEKKRVMKEYKVNALSIEIHRETSILY
jgi:hypothetical protein